jgi:geranylgeranyl diphosphate synthase type II
MDLEFERRTDVSLGEYFTMIEKKTGRLMSLSSELGALLGGASKAQVQSMRRFGHYLGRAFQLQDDLLDVLADEKRFGKRVGGDILEGKKTFLLLRAGETARGRDREYLRRVTRREGRALGPPRTVIRTVTEIYERYGVVREARSLIARNTRHALATLDALPAGNASAMLRWLSEALVNRAS